MMSNAFVCRDCNASFTPTQAATHTYPHADGSASIQCVPCHVSWHETDGGKHAPTFAGLDVGCAACRAGRIESRTAKIARLDRARERAEMEAAFPARRTRKAVST